TPLRPHQLPSHFAPLWAPDASPAAPGMPDPLCLPAQSLLHPSHKIPFLVGAIHPDELETWKAVSERQEQVFAAVMVLNTGLMYQLVHDQPIRVEQEVPLAAFDLFAPVVAAPPPFWLVLTDWLSMMAALAVGSRPCFTRPASRRTVWIRSPVPALRHVRKEVQTVGHGGKSR